MIPGFRTRVLILLVLLAASAPATAQLSDVQDDAPVTVDADHLAYDRDSDTIKAEGDVVITRGGTVLAADKAKIDRRSEEAEVEGAVVIDDPQARVRARRGELELDEETGYLEEGEVYLPRSRFQLGGEYLEKGIGQSYRIWDGNLTTCLCDEGEAPDWRIDGDQVDLHLGGWGTVRGGIFRIKDVPVLYFPYALFPVNRERQSGFLFPQLGISNARGFQYVQPYYWAIDKSSDLTVSTDIETSARLGILADYRYLWSPTEGGRMTASYFNEAIRGSKADVVVDPDVVDPTIPENRWSVIGFHQQQSPWASRLWARPFVVSDKLFLREMNTLEYTPAGNLLLSTVRYTTSELGGIRQVPGGTLRAEARYFQDLIGDQNIVPQPLPRVDLQLRRPFLDRRVELGLGAQSVYYYRPERVTGPRLDIAPWGRLPYRAGPYGFGSVRLVLHETLYYRVNRGPIDLPFETDEDQLQPELFDRFQHRQILEASADFNSEISRVFAVEWGELRKLKHSIEPYLRYNYVPVVSQEELPFYDTLDRINARNLITYGVATRLLGKYGVVASDLPGPSVMSTNPTVTGNALVGNVPYGPIAPLGNSRIRELGRAYLQQSYSITRPILGRDQEDPTFRFSGIDAGLRLTPFDFFGTDSRAVYSIIDRELVFASVGAHLFDPRPVVGEDDLFLPGLRPLNSLSVSYQFNTPFELGTFKSDGVNSINLATTYRVNNQVALSFLGRFDATAGKLLENWTGLRLISGCDCWVIDLAFVDRVNPDEKQVRVLFSLVGLGSLGQQPFAPGVSGIAAPAVSPAELAGGAPP